MKININKTKEQEVNPLKKYFNKNAVIPKKDFLSKKDWIFFGFVIAIILIGDQLTKVAISNAIEENGSVAIIDNFFYFTNYYNTGAAWGMLKDFVWLFCLVTVFAIIGIYMYFLRTKEHEQLTRFGLVLVTSGAIGNFIDRLFLGYVRDFLDFQFGSYNFPVFNIADMAIVIGIILIVIEMLMEEYEIWKISKSM